MTPAAYLGVLLEVKAQKARLELNRFENDLASTAREAHKTNKAVGGIGDRSRSTGREVNKLNREFTFFRNVIGLIRWPALIAGAGGAAQGLSALAAGAVGTTAALRPLAGALVAYPALLGALGQAAGVVALGGIEDLTKALEGDKEALKALTPEGRRFVGVLKELKPEYRELQRTAQKPLLAGAEKGIDHAVKNLPIVKGLVRETAEEIGSLAQEAGRLAGRKGFGEDLAIVGKGNVELIDDMGRASFHLGDALRHVMVEGQPLLRWMGDSVVELSKLVEEESKAARASGEMAEFFGETRDEIERVVSIGQSLAAVLGEIMDAGQPLGDTILKKLDEGADSLERWAESVEGRNELREFFENAEPAIMEAGRLLGDFTTGFFELADTPGLAEFIRQVRTQLLPVMLDVTETTTKEFAPVLIDFLAEAGELLGNFIGSTGPLTHFVQLLTTAAKAVNALFENVPGSANLAADLVTAGAILKLTKGVGGKLGIGAAGGAALGGVGGAAAGKAVGGAVGSGTLAGIGAVLSGKAAAGGALGKAGGLFGTIRTAASRMPKAGLIGIGAGTGALIIDGIDDQMQEGSKKVFDHLRGVEDWSFFGDGPAEGIDELFGGTEWGNKAKAIREDLKFIMGGGTLPAQDFEWIRTEALARGVELTERQREAMEKILQLGERRLHQQQALSRIGIDVDIDDPLKGKTLDNFRALSAGVFTSMKDIDKVVDENSRDIAETLGRRSEDGREAMAGNFRAAAGNIAQMMGRSEISTKQGMKRIEELIRRAAIVDASAKQARGFAREWAKGMDSAKDFTGPKIGKILDELRRMPKASREIAADTWLAQLREAARKNPKLQDEFRDLRSRVVAEFGLAKEGSKKQSAELWAGVANNFGGLGMTIFTALDLIAHNANESLLEFGAKAIGIDLKKPSGKGKGKQRGGGVFSVPGSGTGDIVDTAVRSGTFVLNSRASDAFFRSGGMVPVSLEPGELGFGPEIVARHGAILEAMNAAIPRFQGGGIVGLQGGGRSPFYDEIVSLGHKLQGMGYEVGEHPAFGGVAPVHGHYPPHDHYSGGALDVNDDDAPGGESASLSKLAAMLKGWHVLWQVPDHYDHLHVDTTQGAGALVGKVAAAAAELERIVFTGPDWPGKELAQHSSDTVWKAAKAYVAKHRPSAAEGAEGFGAFAGATGSDADLMRQISKARGWSFPDWWEIDARETGHGANLVNPTSTARLRGQFLDFNWGKYGPGSDPAQDPSMHEQIISMARYIAERYGNPTAALAHHDANNWYSVGGLVEGFAEGGLVGDLLGTVKRAGKGGRKGRKAVKRLKDSITGAGLDPQMQKQLDALAADADRYDQMASMASQMTIDSFTDAAGVEIAAVPGMPGGRDEISWLGGGDAPGAIQKLFELRNAIVKAQEIATKKLREIEELLEKAKDRLDEVQKAMRQAERDRDKVQGDLKQSRKRLEDLLDVKKKRRDEGGIKRERERIEDLRGKLDDIGDGQKVRTRRRDVLKDQIIPAITDQRDVLTGKLFDDLGPALVDVQGLGGPTGPLGSLPDLGVLSGRIFDTQLRLRELGTPDPGVSGGTSITETDTELVSMLQEQLRVANLRAAVLGAQFGVLRDHPLAPYAGAFEKGGWLQQGGWALVGESGRELVHMAGGSAVVPNPQTEAILSGGAGPSVQVVVNGDIVNVPRGKDPVEVLLGDRRLDAKIERVARRLGPRAPGGV